MAVTAERVQIIVEAEVRKALDGLKKTETQSNALFTSVKKLVGPVALGALAIKAVEVGKEFSRLAADAEEVNSKFNTVFKEQASSVREWAETYSESVGRSSTDTLGFLATIQDTLVPLGFMRDAASDMSTEIVKLAGDLASFNNLPTADVIRDIQSGIVGNTETLRKYGVVASMAAIKQEALTSGIIETERELTAQEKAQAILNITIKGTTDAQGDLERTQDSAANTSVRLQSATKDLGIVFGTILNESVTPLKSALADIITSYTDFVALSYEVGKATREQAAGTSTLEQDLLLVNTALSRANEEVERAILLGPEAVAIAEQRREALLTERGAILSKLDAEADELEFSRKRLQYEQEKQDRQENGIVLTEGETEATEELTEAITGLNEANNKIITSFTESTARGTTLAEVIKRLKEESEETGEQFAATAGTLAEGFGRVLAETGSASKALESLVKDSAILFLRSLGEQLAVAAAAALVPIPGLFNPVGAAAAGAASLAAFASAGAISAFAKGGDFMTNGPQMIMVGDNPGGRERVTVTPESSPNINGPQGQNIRLEIIPREFAKFIQVQIDNQQIVPARR